MGPTRLETFNIKTNKKRNLVFVLEGRVIIARLFDHLVNRRGVRRRTIVFWFFVVVNLFVMFVTFRFRRYPTVFLFATLLWKFKFLANYSNVTSFFFVHQSQTSV